MSVVEVQASGSTYQARRYQNIATWTAFFRQCWRKSLDYHQFEAEAKRTFTRAPLNCLDIFEAWSRQIKVQLAVSARMLRYLDILQRLRMIQETTVFEVTINHLGAIFDKQGDPKIRTNQIAELGALVRLTSNTLGRLQGKTIKSRAPSTQLSLSLFRLVGLFAGTAVARGGLITGVVLTIGEAIANFVVAHVNDLSVTGVLASNNGKPPTPLKKAFSKVIPTFIDVLSASESPLAGSLTLLQQQSKLQEGMDDTAEEVTTTVVDPITFTQAPQLDAPVSPSRASLYAYLTAALTAAPKLDDIGLQVFLNVRYHDDIPMMAMDLITASFDVYAGALERKEAMEVLIIHKSFIANKVPSILEQLSHHSAFQSDGQSVSQCIAKAIKRVDECYRNTTVLQPGSEACSKQRFLLACALFDLISESAVPSLLGYPPTQGRAKTRYDKTKLVQECQADTKRIEELVNELNSQEGNAAPIARALLEIMHTLCASRETMTLKMLCHAFLKKQHHINIMMLFINDRLLLQPLCQLLDHWQTQDDQGEQMIVYDEFGTIFLFVLMCQYRFDLPLASFTTPSPDSFISEHFQSGTIAKHSKDISETERKHLSGWVKGLFEGNGLADELMSTCPPKDFYRLAATLTDQILMATQMGAVGIDTALAGVEYLLEPFLLPSLVIVFGMLASRLSSMPGDAPQIDFLMPILMRLAKPPKLSPEAGPLHQSVLFISARPIWQALIHVQMAKKRRDVPELVSVLRNIVHKPFTLSVAKPLLEEWCHTKDVPRTDNKADGGKGEGEHAEVLKGQGRFGGVAITFQKSFDNLIKWNGIGKPVPHKQAYNHRLTVCAVNILGATRALELLLDQASKAATNPKATDQAIDTLTGLIAASTLTSMDSRLSLREALTYANNEAQGRTTTKENAARSTLVMRLHRRVEDHCTRPIEQPPAIIPLTVDVAMPDAAVQAQDMDPAAAAAAIGIKDIPMQDAQGLMDGVTEAAKATDGSVQATQQVVPGGDVMNMGGMGDMGDYQDVGFQDFLQDLNVGAGEAQSFEDIFNQL